MIIMPSGVDQKVFYLKAKEKGIKIISRHLGVHAYELNGRIKWRATIQREGKVIWLKYFPFNEVGEINAADAYLKKYEELGIKIRYNQKRKYNKKS